MAKQANLMLPDLGIKLRISSKTSLCYTGLKNIKSVYITKKVLTKKAAFWKQLSTNILNQ